MQATPHHIGICVTDLDRSVRFWCDGLGFETTSSTELGAEWSDALEIGGPVEFTARFIKKGPFEFELLHYSAPPTHGSPSTSRKQVGFTHLALFVDDLEAMVAHLVECGGTVLESTRTRMGPMELVFVADPDGVRVELMHIVG